MSLCALVALVDTSYESFLGTIIVIYNSLFPVKEIQINKKCLLSPWMTKGLLKSSQKTQNLYNTYLKNKTFLNEVNYKKYKNLFEGVKNQSRKQHFSSLLIKYQGNAKQTWETIKNAIGK